MKTIKMLMVNHIWAWIECHSRIKDDRIIVFDEWSYRKVGEKLYELNRLLGGDAPDWKIEIANIKHIIIE